MGANQVARAVAGGRIRAPLTAQRRVGSGRARKLAGRPARPAHELWCPVARRAAER